MTIGNPRGQLDRTQRRIQSFAFVLAGGFCVLICVFFAVGRYLGSAGSEPAALDERINPNEAPAASLVRLPGIGLGRAEAIVAYRENLGPRDRGRPAFRNCDDLKRVRGIGAKTVQDVSEWLAFE